MNLHPSKRWIAPDDFLAKLAGKVSIEFNTAVELGLIEEAKRDGVVMINTIPMPIMMKLVGWKSVPEFKKQPITTISGRIVRPHTNVYQTIYYPSVESEPYRASITGDRVIIEYLGSSAPTKDVEAELTSIARNHFGIFVHDLAVEGSTTQPFGKLLPINEADRRQFIVSMTDFYGMYSLGRFGTWRQILLDDVVHDIQMVEKFMRDRDRYSRSMSMISNKGTKP
jgi:hypothetical protein